MFALYSATKMSGRAQWWSRQEFLQIPELGICKESDKKANYFDVVGARCSPMRIGEHWQDSECLLSD
jgi:hypothetical protein